MLIEPRRRDADSAKRWRHDRRSFQGTQSHYPPARQTDEEQAEIWRLAAAEIRFKSFETLWRKGTMSADRGGRDKDAEEIAALNQLFDSLTYRETRKFLKLVKSPYPRFLYKFRNFRTTEDINHLGEIIVGSQLWLSSPVNFNDPFDMQTKFVFDATVEEKRKRVRDALREQGKKFHEIQRELPQIMMRSEAENIAIATETHRQMISEIGVCSFAGDPRNIQMWSHYASNHEGLCLVFEIARDAKTFAHALTVNYSAEYPIMNWVKDFRARIKDIVLRKQEGWKYEKERRIIKLDQANTSLKFSPKALRAIITGCCIKDGSFEKLKDLLRQRAAAHMPQVEIYECFRHESLYKLNIFKKKF